MWKLEWKLESLPGLILLLLLLLSWSPSLLLVSSKDLNTTSWLSSYEIVIPKKLESKQVSDGEVSYSIVIAGKQNILHLKKKIGLLPQYLPVFTYSKSGALILEEPHIQDNCYFHGYVEGISDSYVSLSTCNGLRGFLNRRDLNYGIEPLEPFSKFQHLIYRTDSETFEQMLCGINETNEKDFLKLISEDIAPAPGDIGIVLPDIQYVEAFVVVSNQRFENVNNETAMIMEIISIVNAADSILQQLNIRVVLVGIEIWTTEDFINPKGDVLTDFNVWKSKNLDRRVHHDSGAFVLQQGAGALGLAYIGAICSPGLNGFFATLSSSKLVDNAVIYAHELGHTLGLVHDEKYCHCKEVHCVMYPVATPYTSFSNCSRSTLVRMTVYEGTRCLWDYPAPGTIYVMKRCGNKIVEKDEECDCGSVEECKQDKCCQPGTCRLKNTAECGHGECCKNCKFAPAGSQCRPSTSECDLPEVCTGSSSICPADVYVKNGLPCKQEKFVCYNKVCYDYNQHCKGIFGPDAEVAPKACFQSANIRGDRFGNCGFANKIYMRCSHDDSMCGRLQCVEVYNLPHMPDHSTIVQTSVEMNLCYGVDHHFGMDMMDFGAVYDGAKCDSGKICIGRKCVSLSSIPGDCNSATTCNGHGVCNNKNNCHCEKGFSPPTCTSGGLGGSRDSGPMHDISHTNIPTTTEMTYITRSSIKGFTTTVHPDTTTSLKEKEKAPAKANVTPITLGIAIPFIIVTTCVTAAFGMRYKSSQDQMTED